jgi:hypothetical protein
VILPKPGIISSTFIGSGEDTFTNPDASAVLGSRSGLAEELDRGGPMLFKKSSTLTADAEGLAEASSPAEAVGDIEG